MEKEKKNYLNIFLATPVAFMIIELVQTVPVFVLGKIDNGTAIYYMFNSAVSSVTSCILAGFYINAVRNGRGDLNNATILFKKEVFAKFIPLMLIKAVMDTVVNMAIIATENMGVLNNVVSIISSLILMMFLPVWHLLVLNPSKDTATYFKFARNLMTDNIGKYLGVVSISMIAFIIAIVIVLPIVLSLNIFGLVLYIPFLLAGGSILMMVVSNFMNEVIPPEWENDITLET